MSRCARERRVFFVEEPHFDVAVPYLEVQHVEHGLHVAVPHLTAGLPPDVTENLQRGLVESLVARMEIRDPLLWFYTPMAMGYADAIRGSGVVYDCMDELSHFRGAPPQLVDRERALFRLADLVFTGGQSLYEAKRAHHPRVHAFPSSVDSAISRRRAVIAATPRTRRRSRTRASASSA
jgi:UDP-galactopyranose mutase